MAETTTPAYTIRYATEHDVPVILQIINELAVYEKAGHEVMATPETLYNTLSFPTSESADVRNKPGFAKTLLIIPNTADSKPEVETSDKSSSTRSAVRTSPDQVAGMALYFNNYSTWLAQPGIYLEDLFVRPAHRKKGYGKALLQALARECVAQNFGRLEWSVLKWNKPSIDFYVSDTIGAFSLGEEWEGMRVTGEKLKILAGSK